MDIPVICIVVSIMVFHLMDMFQEVREATNIIRML